MVGSITKQWNKILNKCIFAFENIRFAKMRSSNQLVLLRHGESEFNKKNWFCGWHDCPLSDLGKQQALDIAATNLIKHNMTQFDCIYTSRLTRAKDTVNIIMNALKHPQIPIHYDWRLNERHYGDLTGFNKREMADKYGEEQVQKWRRKFDVVPPAINKDNPYYLAIVKNPNFCDIPPEKFPASESMEMTLKRTIDLWTSEILPKVLNGERVLIISHGTTTRSLVKHIEGMSNTDIDSFNIPNSVPCVYEFDLQTGIRIGGIKYLADEAYVTKEANKVALIGEKNISQAI